MSEMSFCVCFLGYATEPYRSCASMSRSTCCSTCALPAAMASMLSRLPCARAHVRGQVRARPEGTGG